MDDDNLPRGCRSSLQILLNPGAQMLVAPVSVLVAVQHEHMNVAVVEREVGAVEKVLAHKASDPLSLLLAGLQCLALC